jgi:hypothetical protein
MATPERKMVNMNPSAWRNGQWSGGGQVPVPSTRIYSPRNAVMALIVVMLWMYLQVKV